MTEPPTPARDGYAIAVYLPPGVTETDRDRLYDAIADVAHHGDGNGWDVHVVGVPGDPMGICHEPIAEGGGRAQRNDEDRAYEQAMRKRKRGRTED